MNHSALTQEQLEIKKNAESNAHVSLLFNEFAIYLIAFIVVFIATPLISDGTLSLFYYNLEKRNAVEWLIFCVMTIVFAAFVSYFSGDRTVRLKNKMKDAYENVRCNECRSQFSPKEWTVKKIISSIPRQSVSEGLRGSVGEGGIQRHYNTEIHESWTEQTIEATTHRTCVICHQHHSSVRTFTRKANVHSSSIKRFH